MGNQNGHSYGLDPTLHARLLQSEPGVQIFQDAQGEEFEKYVVMHDCSVGFDQAYQFRVNNRHNHLVDVIFAGTQFPIQPLPSPPLGCTKAPSYQVVTERIPYRLSHLPPQQPENALTLLQAALRGFRDLFRVHGVMRVRDSMIAVTPKNRVKVWLNPNFALNTPEDKPLSLKNLDPPSHQREMVHNIFDLISSKAENAPLWREIVQIKQQRNIHSFDDAITLVDSFITNKNIKVDGELRNPFNKQLYGKRSEHYALRSEIDKLEEINKQHDLADRGPNSPKTQLRPPKNSNHSSYPFSQLRAKVIDPPKDTIIQNHSNQLSKKPPNTLAEIESQILSPLENKPQPQSHSQPQPQSEPSLHSQSQPRLHPQFQPQHQSYPKPPQYQSHNRVINQPQLKNMPQPAIQLQNQAQPISQINFKPALQQPFKQMEKRVLPTPEPQRDFIKSHSVSIQRPVPSQFRSFQLQAPLPGPQVRDSHITHGRPHISPAGRSPSHGNKLQVRFNYTKQPTKTVQPMVPLTKSINLLAVNVNHYPPTTQIISNHPTTRLLEAPNQTLVAMAAPTKYQQKPKSKNKQSSGKQQLLDPSKAETSVKQKQPVPHQQYQNGHYLNQPQSILQQMIPSEEPSPNYSRVEPLKQQSDESELNESQIKNKKAHAQNESLVNKSQKNDQMPLKQPIVSNGQEGKVTKPADQTAKSEMSKQIQDIKQQLRSEGLQSPSYQIKINQISSEQQAVDDYFLDRVQNDDFPHQSSTQQNKHPQTDKQQTSPDLQHQPKQKFTPFKQAPNTGDKSTDMHKNLTNKITQLGQLKEQGLSSIPQTNNQLSSAGAKGSQRSLSENPSAQSSVGAKGKLKGLTYREMRKMLLQTLQRS